MNPHRIPNYNLYGEKDHWQSPEPLHCERIHERSALHNWEIEPHRHDALLQVLFLSTGCAELSIDGNQTSIEDPCVVLIPAMTVHGFEFTDGSDGVVVMLDQSALGDILSSAPAFLVELQSPFLLQNDELGDSAEELRATFDELLHEYVSSRQGRLLATNAHLALIFLRILRLRIANRGKRASIRSREEEIASKFKDLVDRHFRDHQDVTFFAESLCMTKPKLVAITKSVFGSTPSAVIHSRLILEARRNLAYTSIGVAEVAYDLGFKDPAYFSRFFKRHTGVTPADYRSRVAKKT